MNFYIKWDNCRKQYPEIELRLDVRGIVHIICPQKYSPRNLIKNVADMLELENEELAFSPTAAVDTSHKEKWYAEISIGVKAEFFVKENPENTPENGKITRDFAILRFPNPENPISDKLQIYQVNSGEEAHKMAFEDKNCIGYTLTRRVDTMVDGRIVRGEPDTIKMVIFGKVYTREEVLRMKDEKASYIHAIMMIFGRNKYVQTRNGNFIPWKKDTEYFSEGIE